MENKETEKYQKEPFKKGESGSGYIYEGGMNITDPNDEEYSAPSDPFSPPDVEVKGKKE